MLVFEGRSRSNAAAAAPNCSYVAEISHCKYCMKYAFVHRVKSDISKAAGRLHYVLSKSSEGGGPNMVLTGLRLGTRVPKGPFPPTSLPVY